MLSAEFEVLSRQKSADVIALAKDKGVLLAVAESCSGGILSSVLTSVPGASAVFERGLVVYSLRAKIDLLLVDESLLRSKGTVNADVAVAMCEGLLSSCAADIVLSVTGELGPNLNDVNSKIGAVYIGHGVRGGRVSHSYLDCGRGDRCAMRHSVAIKCLDLLLSNVRDFDRGLV